MRKLVVYFISCYCMTSALGSSCINPKYASVSDPPIEVYQMKQFVEVSSASQEAAVKVEVLKNSLELPSGTVCRYDVGECFDPNTHQMYAWVVSKENPTAEILCTDIRYLSLDENGNNYTYYILTLREDPLVRYLIAQSAVSMFFIQLLAERTFCGKQIWRTDHDDVVVAVGKENFVEAVHEDFLFEESAMRTTIYDLERKEDAYSSMMIKCELYSSQVSTRNAHFEKELTDLMSSFNSTQEILIQYTQEITKLKADIRRLRNQLSSKNSELARLKEDLEEIYSIKPVVRKLQRELNKYKIENTLLRESFGRLESDLVLENLKETEEITDVHEADDVEEVETPEDTRPEFSQKFANILASYDNCPDCILFPYENLFCIVIALFYVSFSIINTIMNYFSLRMLRSERQKCFVFYTLTQGLTTRYICKCLYLTKEKVDKWLLDIVE